MRNPCASAIGSALLSSPILSLLELIVNQSRTVRGSRSGERVARLPSWGELKRFFNESLSNGAIITQPLQLLPVLSSWSPMPVIVLATFRGMLARNSGDRQRQKRENVAICSYLARQGHKYLLAPCFLQRAGGDCMSVRKVYPQRSQQHEACYCGCDPWRRQFQKHTVLSNTQWRRETLRLKRNSAHVSS